MRPVVAFLLASSVGLTAAACSGPETTAASPPASAAVVQLAPDNVVTAGVADLSTGPIVSGELTPAREATVRAQVGGSLVALSVDRGQAVAGGAEVARIASRDLDAAMASADAAVKSAAAVLAVARTEAQRTGALVAGGALATRDLEQAQNAVANAEAQAAAARARQRAVGQQIDDTSVRAPFSGVVSARPASLGDVVAPGTELFTVIDPSSLRLEARVPSDRIAEVRAGAKVRFQIRGVPGDFVGTVDRVSPVADPVTRQVSIFVSIPNVGGRLIAGLFAEGQVETVTHRGIVVPLSAVDETGIAPTATVVRDGKADVRAVKLGVRRAQTEQVEILDGVAPGEVLIVGAAKGVAPGTPIRIVQ
jgi:RND family efflux transporter MFP subunit